MGVYEYRFRGAGVPNGGYQQLPSGMFTMMDTSIAPDGQSVRFKLPGILDSNHLNGVGPLYLTPHLSVPAAGSPGQLLNMNGGKIEIVAKLSSDFDARGHQWSPWFCRGYNPSNDPMNIDQATNWAMTGVNYFSQLNTSTFATAVANITADPTKFTYAGMDWLRLGEITSGKYGEYPLVDTLTGLNGTLHNPIYGLQRVDRPPVGSIDIDRIIITTANAPTPRFDFSTAMTFTGTQRYHALAALARNGDVSAKTWHARVLSSGILAGSSVSDPNYIDAEAAVNMLTSIQGNNPIADVTLAMLIGSGIGGTRDMTLARALLSAWPNYPEARYRLGIMRLHGLGGSQSSAGAQIDFEWAATHCKPGEPFTIYQAGAMVAAGREHFKNRDTVNPTANPWGHYYAYWYLARAKKFEAELSVPDRAVLAQNLATVKADMEANTIYRADGMDQDAAGWSPTVV